MRVIPVLMFDSAAGAAGGSGLNKNAPQPMIAVDRRK